VLPPDIVGAATVKAMQSWKSFADTWMLPVHGPKPVWPVSVAGFIAWLNVTAIVLLGATPTAPSAGVVLTTSGGRQAPVLSHPAAHAVAQQLPDPAAPQMPELHWLLPVHAVPLAKSATHAPEPLQ
jgi:predicted amidohydrolase YtcJ